MRQIYCSYRSIKQITFLHETQGGDILKEKLKKHKAKIIAGAIIAAALVFAFWYGGRGPGMQSWTASSDYSAISSDTPQSSPSATTDLSGTPKTQGQSALPITDSSTSTSGHDSKAEGNEDEPDKPSAIAPEEPEDARPEDTPEPSGPPDPDPGRPLTVDEKVDLDAELSGESSAGVQEGDADNSEPLGMDINPETGKDIYSTSPVPDERPMPVEPQDTEITDEAYSCTLSVRCDTILDNINWLGKEKWELVPEDGVIFPAATVTFYEGESVFNVLWREMKRAKIHMEFMNNPIYNSAYILGINNLYEFDVGELSGWVYKVNDWFPNYGCSRYELKDGDVIEWLYTCNLGVDIGGYNAIGTG